MNHPGLWWALALVCVGTRQMAASIIVKENLVASKQIHDVKAQSIYFLLNHPVLRYMTSGYLQTYCIIERRYFLYLSFENNIIPTPTMLKEYGHIIA